MTLGESLVSVLTTIRRYKSEHNLALASDIQKMQVAAEPPELASFLEKAIPDLSSACRALEVQIVDQPDGGMTIVGAQDGITVAIQL